MDRIEDSGSLGWGSIPHGSTQKAARHLETVSHQADTTFCTAVLPPY